MLGKKTQGKARTTTKMFTHFLSKTFFARTKCSTRKIFRLFVFKSCHMGPSLYVFPKMHRQCLMAHFTVEEDGVKISFEVRKIVRVIDNTLGLDGRLR